MNDEIPMKSPDVDRNQEPAALLTSDLASSKNNNFQDAWQKTKHTKITADKLITELSKDGIAVKLNAEKEVLNSEILRHSLVELRKQWNKFGNFHMTSIGLNWILCSFKSLEAMEEVLSGGPWFVGGYIVGMDKWSPYFNPKSFKGISAPVWIRLPCFPLYCWDEENIIHFASRIGAPMLLDGNSFKWGKREFAWCGKVGHDSKVCPDIVRKKAVEQGGNMAEVVKNGEDVMEMQGEDGDYGPWIHVKFKNKRIRNDNMTMAGRNGKNNAFDQVKKNVAKDVSIEESGKENAAECELGISTANKFDALLEDVEEGEVRELPCVEQQQESGAVDLPEKIDVVASQGNSLVKTKLVKELKSLGPLEPEHRKKRKEGGQEKRGFLVSQGNY
ncbi:uncharacterized protein LOC110093001 [Dendrobium catenatum]|uniref:uncharacterized protein LOC110093001 n=1 Tax=Dendrobium catenatum TaxID=906689 RepID=UPI00109F5631|nr:uncharacterized protein LOC110093001 [Dendrobium catenatum]